MKLVLLFVGSVMVLFGLLKATNERFQHWFLEREGKVAINSESEEYKAALLHMKISGSRLMFIGSLLVLLSLSDLGFID